MPSNAFQVVNDAVSASSNVVSASSGAVRVFRIRDTPAGPGLTRNPAPDTFSLPHTAAPMEDTLRPRIAMLRAVLAHFDAHPELWADKDPIARNVGFVRDGLVGIEGAAERQAGSDPEGFTEDKAAARDAAEELLADLSAGATAYADEAGDADLEAAVDVSRTTWDRMAEADFFARAAVVLDRVEGALGVLAEYDVTKEEVATARAAVEAARPGTEVRDNVVADRGASTAALGSGYSSVVRPLRRLDKLVPRQVRDAAFVAEYRRVRRVTGQ